MYLAVKDLGHDVVAQLRELPTTQEKIRVYQEYLRTCDVEGVHLESRYDDIGLPLTQFPYEILEHYRLTYHVNGLRELVTEHDEEAHHAVLAQVLELVAAVPAIEDVSFHPPGFFPPESDGYIPDERRAAIKYRLQRLLAHWIPKYAAYHTTVSIESHITPQYFCFNGPDDYMQFIQETPGVGALLDVAHNHFDGFDNTALIAQLGERITGFHLSDTNRGAGFPDGLHLEIGQGEIDFHFLQAYSWQPHVFGAIEVKGQFQNIRESVQVLTQRYLSAQRN